jgi:hypothetical protein
LVLQKAIDLNLIFRLIYISLALVALAWGVWRFQIAQSEGSLIGMATAVISGSEFDQKQIVAVLRNSDGSLNPASCILKPLHARVILNLRLAETALSSLGSSAIAQAFAGLKNSIADFRRCHVDDGFVDLAEYWFTINDGGSIQAALPLLENSFFHAPGEGWIIGKRVWLAFGIFDVLPPTLQQRAINDVGRMLNARLVNETAELLIKLPPKIRILVANSLKTNSPKNISELRAILQRRAELGMILD